MIRTLAVIMITWMAGCCLYGQSDSTNFDPLLLNEVIISDFAQSQKITSGNSIFTIRGQDLGQISSVASQLEKVPGIFVDGSLGEVFSRVHGRGISLSAEDDIGWYYTGLYEDGLPVSAVQFNHFTPDFFFRQDLSIERLEVLKGGKSGILGQNSPGGLISYYTHPVQNSYSSHDKITGGIHKNGRLYGRIEGFSGGPIGEKGWHHGFSYLYRYDRGARNTDYAFNKGGQIKASVTKTFRKGLFSFRTKYLDDKVNRYTGLAATDWEYPQAAFGQNFSTSSLLPPAISGVLPDARTSGNETLEYNPANGIKSKELSFQTNLDLAIGNWVLKNRTKYSIKDVNWQSAIGGQPLGLENFLTYFISGDEFPVGLIQFSEVQSGNSLALVNNFGILNAFQGLAPSFEYIEGSLPNDAIMGAGTWLKDDDIDEFMNDLRFQKKDSILDLTLGTFFSHSAVEIFTNASFLYTTYEPSPRALEVNLVNPGEPVRSLSDPFGLSNYGALFYDRATLSVDQIAIYGEAQFEVADNTSFDLGMRMERISHSGTKDRSAPLSANGGLDGNPLTSYDNGQLAPTGKDDIDFDYTYLSYSLGINYVFNENSAGYVRYSNTNKAPEVNYYLNNFSNVPVSGKGEVQDIQQFELGLKHRGKSNSLALTGFYSRLDDVPFSEFVFDQDNNQIFYTPTQLNSSETIGIELEWIRKLSDYFGINFATTLQKGLLVNYRQYSANGTIDTQDDAITDFSGNRLPHTPSVISNVEVFYDHSKTRAAISWRHTGDRFANFENSFKLKAFNSFEMSLEHDLSKHIYFGIVVRNIFNSSGLINFFGPNEFGSNANQATREFIVNNNNASFVVFPILPRSIYFSVGYRFKK